MSTVDAAPIALGTKGTVLIRGIEVPTITQDVDYRELRFYVDNPRIYSFVRIDNNIPTQDEILRKLLELNHIKELIHDIKANDGLIDPLIVRSGDFVVMEGNSRLAAYHFLARTDPTRWNKVRCTLLPGDIDDKLVFALLAQYHVKGKKDWAPYEKAGFIYRRFKHQNVDLPIVAAEMNLTKDEARHFVNVYEFMLLHKDVDRDNWSYYDEFLKSRKIKKARTEISEFDEFVVKEIRFNKIERAMDLRDKLPVICSSNTKILKRYMSGVYDFADAYEAAVTAGGENHTLNKLGRFRKWLVEATTEDDLLEAAKHIRDKMQYELKEIEKKAKKLKELLDGKKGQIG